MNTFAMTELLAVMFAMFTAIVADVPASGADGPFVSKISLLGHPIVAENLLSPLTSDQLTKSYVIEQTRFVEKFPTRCKVSTIPDNLDLLEPEFVMIKKDSVLRLKATASKDEILAAGFAPNKRTTIFVHGFKQGFDRTAWMKAAFALFESNMLVGGMNIIFMDWGSSSRGSFKKVAARASVMGAYLANFLMKLFDLGTDRKQVHMIGNSLGAHISGFAGKRIRPKIGRITALDPAGPCFGKVSLNAPDDRLNANDAYEVDVYHFNDALLGLSEKLGQFDVFVNGGKIQPGCPNKWSSMVEAAITVALNRPRPLSKSHTRSTEVATADLSTANQCQMVAYNCDSWAAFQAGECGRCDETNKQCFAINFHHQLAYKPDPEPLRRGIGESFYIATGKDNPYCLHHYQIVAKFSEPEKKTKTNSYYTLETKNSYLRNLKLRLQLANGLNVTISHKLKGGVYTHLLLSAADQEPRRFDVALVEIQRTIFDKLISAKANLNSLEFNYMSNIEPAVRRRFSSRLCLADSPHTDKSSSKNSEWVKLKDCRQEGIRSRH